MAKVKAPPEFIAGSKVKVKGRKPVYIVTHPMVVPVPSVVNGQFALVDHLLLKFITKEETFYCWSTDAKPA